MGVQPLSDKTVIITGASSGLGAAVAVRLGREGMRVALAARRAASLEQVAAQIQAAGGQALVLPTDVRDQRAVQRMVASVLGEWGQIDVLFNNAGLGCEAPVDQIDPDKLRNQVAVNVVGAIECAQAVLPAMRERNTGHIINVSSIAGLIPLPGWSTYSATKAAICAFSEAVRRELRGTQVRVTAFCPYWVETHLSPLLEPPPPGQKPPHLLIPILKADAVAQAVIGLLRRPRRQLILPWYFSFLAAGANLSPEIADYIVPWFVPRA